MSPGGMTMGDQWVQGQGHVGWVTNGFKGQQIVGHVVSVVLLVGQGLSATTCCHHVVCEDGLERFLPWFVGND